MMKEVSQILETILDRKYKITSCGYRVSHFVIPKKIQVKIAVDLLPSRPGEEGLIRLEDTEMIEKNGILQLFGYPVKDGKALQVRKIKL